MRRVSFMFIVAVFLCAGMPLFAQGFLATFFSYEQVLDDNCTGEGTPFPDSVIVWIVQDITGSSTPWNDPLPRLIESSPNPILPFAEWRYVGHFRINGGSMGFPGFFFSETYFSWPEMPWPNRFCLLVCHAHTRYYSEIFSVIAGPQDIFLSSWTCSAPAPCLPDCPAPGRVSSFSAADGVADSGVVLTWTHAPDSTASGIDSILLVRDEMVLAVTEITARGYTDTRAVPGRLYWYSLYVRRTCGQASRMSAPCFNPGWWEPRAIAPELPAVSGEFRLHQSSPNPFNAQTRIAFTLPRGEIVRLEIFDVTGRSVAVLADGRFTAGRHELHFDGSSLSSGVYICRLESISFTATQKLLLLK